MTWPLLTSRNTGKSCFSYDERTGVCDSGGQREWMQAAKANNFYPGDIKDSEASGMHDQVEVEPELKSKLNSKRICRKHLCARELCEFLTINYNDQLFLIVGTDSYLKIFFFLWLNSA